MIFVAGICCSAIASNGVGPSEEGLRGRERAREVLMKNHGKAKGIKNHGGAEPEADVRTETTYYSDGTIASITVTDKAEGKTTRTDYQTLGPQLTVPVLVEVGTEYTGEWTYVETPGEAEHWSWDFDDGEDQDSGQCYVTCQTGKGAYPIYHGTWKTYYEPDESRIAQQTEGRYERRSVWYRTKAIDIRDGQDLLTNSTNWQWIECVDGRLHPRFHEDRWNRYYENGTWFWNNQLSESHNITYNDDGVIVGDLISIAHRSRIPYYEDYNYGQATYDIDGLHAVTGSYIETREQDGSIVVDAQMVYHYVDGRLVEDTFTDAVSGGSCITAYTYDGDDIATEVRRDYFPLVTKR